MTRRPLVVGNWKMNGTLAESVLLTRSIQAQFTNMSATMQHPQVDVVIAPPFTALAIVADQLENMPASDMLHLELGAQTMDAHDSGAFTGEISAMMLTELGVRWVILGHSERRARCGETDTSIAEKVVVALANGLTPVIAVGESRDEHAADRSRETVVAQTRAALAHVDIGDVPRCVIAYEPIWAIGSGRSDDPQHADAVMQAIRTCVDGLRNARLLYGGSVRADNAAAYFERPNIDGALVGGASLMPDNFAAIVQAADASGRIFQRS